jgi:hypothetical protein
MQDDLLEAGVRRLEESETSPELSAPGRFEAR